MTPARQFLLSTAILALASGSAFADDNFSNVVQSGSDNTGIVVQGPGDENELGTSVDAARQTGDRNSLDIEQAGDRNQVGTRGSGLDQTGNNNVLVIDQLSDNNRVNQISQSSGGGAVMRNSATITQQSAPGEPADSRSTVTNLSQEHVSGPANTATIVQTSENDGGNIIGARGRASVSGGVTQIGGGNAVELTQTGQDNRIRESYQDGQRNSLAIRQDGNDNLAEAAQIGDRNGDPALGGFDGFIAFSSSVTQGFVEQAGDGNSARLDLNGDRNLFGIAQFGASNEVLGRVNGDANEFALSQIGDLNRGRIRIGDRLGPSDRNLVVLNQDTGFSFGNEGRIRVDGNQNLVSLDQLGIGVGNVGLIDIFGNQNGVGVAQLGSNDAEILVTGNRNGISLNQAGLNSALIHIAGNQNDITALQLSGLGGNELTASVEGNRNRLNVLQTDTALFGGLANSIDVSIHGNRNNSATVFSSGWASAAVAGGLLGPGDLVQAGSGNSISLDVGTSSDPTSNDNQFAFAQFGDGNGIEGSIMGIGNEVAVIQAGNNNYTSFSQIGNFNSIGVTQ